MLENPKVLTLLDEVSTDIPGPAVEWPGGEGTLQIVGTWDGATVTITGSIDGGVTYTAPLNSAYTADAIVKFQMGPGKVLATVSSAGTTSLSAYLSRP
jgi:hypothetical protein